MTPKSAYIFKELEASGSEGRRLSAQAKAFVELELPAFLSKIKPGSLIGDFGCGTGVISSAMASFLPDGKVVGLDPDEKALEMAAQEGKGRKNLSFERFGFGDPGLPKSGPFDAVFTRLVLLHLPDPAAALRQMAAALKAGGLLYVVDCDDDYVNFEPKQPWQGELISAMKGAQAARGGTRVLGSKLLGMLSQAGLWPEGQEVLYYSTELLGMERWKEIFLPALGNMAERDLQALEAQGPEGALKADACRQGLQDFFNDKGSKAQLSAWHAWARKA
jgi:SAM-dependent methyltransferase